MYTTITLKQLLDILPLQTANGIKKGDLSTVICLEDIVDNLSYTDKKDFANNNLERLMRYADGDVTDECVSNIEYSGGFSINDVTDQYSDEELLDVVSYYSIKDYVDDHMDDDDLIEILTDRGYVVGE